MKKTELPIVPGLEGVVVCETAVSCVGHEKGLIYRGFPLDKLVRDCSYDQVAYLLMYGKLPDDTEEREFMRRVADGRKLHTIVKQAIGSLPRTTHPMDVLKVGVTAQGIAFPEQSPSARSARKIGATLLGALPAMLGFFRNAVLGELLRKEPKGDKPESIAAHALRMVGEGTDAAAMGRSLIGYGDHDLNASTFATRVCASTRADIYSAICAGICTLYGPLHGKASEDSLDLILSFGNLADAFIGIQNMLVQKKKIPGFGHRMYKHGDPRSGIIKKDAWRLCRERSCTELLKIAEVIEMTMFAEKHLYPNVDFYTAIVYHLFGIDQHFFTALFEIGRLPGAIAHIIEQRELDTLIRPMARYIGSQPDEVLHDTNSV